jgi:uncharacterized protein YndB with AHSA1/START domain/uncharacterized protein YciI
MGPLPPIRRQVVVAGNAEVAFDVFTSEIGLWWPVARFSVHRGAVAFEDGRLVERGPDGAEAVWGKVLDWEPPRRVRLTWHPGSDPSTASEVEVSFAPVTDDLTMVTVEHRGWERFTDPAAARDEYGHGWPHVLAGLVAHAGDTAGSGGGPVWLALQHTPGPAVDGPAEVFTHPDFAEHVAFLRRLRERGVLVAAGPFPASGEGMAVLRLADPADVAGYVRLAHEDDLSVVRGVLQVRVRSWHVALTSNGDLG